MARQFRPQVQVVTPPFNTMAGQMDQIVDRGPRTFETERRGDQSPITFTWQHSWRPTPLFWPPLSLDSAICMSGYFQGLFTNKAKLTMQLTNSIFYIAVTSAEGGRVKWGQMMVTLSPECVMRTVPETFRKNANALLGLDPRYLELRFINQATNPLALWTLFTNTKYFE